MVGQPRRPQSGGDRRRVLGGRQKDHVLPGSKESDRSLRSRETTSTGKRLACKGPWLLEELCGDSVRQVEAGHAVYSLQE